jgi:hypothetical protein
MLPVKVAVLVFFSQLLTAPLGELSRFWLPFVTFAALISLI